MCICVPLTISVWNKSGTLWRKCPISLNKHMLVAIIPCPSCPGLWCRGTEGEGRPSFFLSSCSSQSSFCLWVHLQWGALDWGRGANLWPPLSNTLIWETAMFTLHLTRSFLSVPVKSCVICRPFGEVHEKASYSSTYFWLDSPANWYGAVRQQSGH